MRLGTLSVATSPAGPLNVSVTRTVITSTLRGSCSTRVTSPANSAAAQSYHCPGGTSLTNRQACAAPAASWNSATRSRRATLNAAYRRSSRRPSAVAAK